MRLGEPGLVCAADGADDGRAEMLRPLAEDEADAAGGGVDQDDVAGFDRVGAAHQVLRGHALEHHRRRLLLRDVVGQPDQALGREQPRLGIGPQIGPLDPGIGHAVAGLDDGDVFAHGLDHAGPLGPEDRGQGDRVHAAAVVRIDVVEPHRRVANERLARARPADLDLVPGQDLGPAGPMYAHGHGHRRRLLRAVRPQCNGCKPSSSSSAPSEVMQHPYRSILSSPPSRHTPRFDPRGLSVTPRVVSAPILFSLVRFFARGVHGRLHLRLVSFRALRYPGPTTGRRGP